MSAGERTPKLTHEELQAQVTDLARAMGWKWLHVRRSIGKGRKWVTATNVKGWPDLLLWSPRQPGRHLAIEVKVPPDTLRPEQEVVLADLAASGFEVLVMTPTTFVALRASLTRRRSGSAPRTPPRRSHPAARIGLLLGVSSSTA